MTIEEAISQQYGVRIPRTPDDLKLRKFKVDQLRNGFLIKCREFGVFGSFIDAECFIWSEKGVQQIEKEHKDNKEIRHEWLIWRAAEAMIERGERMSREDAERLRLAVDRLESWL